MRIQVVAIFIVVILCARANSQSFAFPPSSSFKSDNDPPKVSLDANKKENLSFSTIRKMKDSYNISLVNNIELQKKNQNSTLNITRFTLYKDILDYSNKSWPYTNFSTSFTTSISENETIMYQGNDSVIYDFSQAFNLLLTDPLEYVAFDFKSISFNYTDDEFAVVKLEWRVKIGSFDFFFIYFLAASNYSLSLFQSSYSPSSEWYTVLPPMSSANLSVAEIHRITNSTAPVLIRELNILAYRPNGVNVNLTLGDIDILQKVSFDSEQIVSNISGNLLGIHDIPPNSSIFISSSTNYLFSLEYARTYLEPLQFTGYPDIRYEGVIFQGTLSLNLTEYYSEDLILLPPSFKNMSLSINGGNTTGQIINVNLYQRPLIIAYSGYLPSTSIPISFPLSQNSSYYLHNLINIVSGMSFSFTKSSAPVDINSTSLVISIPEFWKKGIIKVVGYNMSGWVLVFTGFVSTYPTSIFADSIITIDPFVRLPIKFSFYDSENNISVSDFKISWNITSPISQEKNIVWVEPLLLSEGNYSVLFKIEKNGYMTAIKSVLFIVLTPSISWNVSLLRQYSSHVVLSIFVNNFSYFSIPLILEVFGNSSERYTILSNTTQIAVSINGTGIIKLNIVAGSYLFSKTLTFNPVFSSSKNFYTVTTLLTKYISSPSQGSFQSSLYLGYTVSSFIIGGMIIAIWNKFKLQSLSPEKKISF